MTKPPAAIACAVVAILSFSCMSCGTSGSNPTEFPEVHFQVRPPQGGQTVFTVDELIAGGVRHASITGRPFVATSTFEIILENAAPPYHAVFSRPPCDPNAPPCAADITVTISVIAQDGQTQVSDATFANTTPSKDSAVLDCVPTTNFPSGVQCVGGTSLGGTPPAGTPNPTPAAANPEVRFDVCTPAPGASTCFTATDSGTFGVTFSGTLGDLATTHLLNGTTPSIYFLEAPSHSVNAVFRTGSINQSLLVQMYINGTQQQAGSGIGDIVIRQDL